MKNQIHKRWMWLLLATMVLVAIFSGCYKLKRPVDGRWESENGKLIVSYEKAPSEAILTINGEQCRYLFGVEHGTTDIELCSPDDGKPIFQGKILSYNENEWLITIDGTEYCLHRVSEPIQ